MKMKKAFLLMLFLCSMAISLTSCGGDEPSGGKGKGSIYGVVTTSGEPLQGIGVSLFKGTDLLLKTVTYGDGSYEFANLSKGRYILVVEDEAYEKFETSVVVESGRQARADMKLVRINTHIQVSTRAAKIDGATITLSGKYEYDYSDNEPWEWGFYYSESGNPLSGIKVSGQYESSGTFSTTLRGLSPGTYYFQAYALNKFGETYGSVLSFTAQEAKAYISLFDIGLMVQTQDLGQSPWEAANQACRDSRVGGFSDWRLPTLPELTTIYNRRSEIGGFETDRYKGTYWSSTEDVNASPYYYYYYTVDFWNGGIDYYFEDNNARIRAVRTIR